MDIKAQMLFTVIVPIPKCWVTRRHATQKNYNSLNIPRINEHFGSFSRKFVKSRFFDMASPSLRVAVLSNVRTL